MDKFAAAVGAIFLMFGVIFLAVIFGAFLGALAGWVVGLVFSDAILGVLAAMGIKGITMWQFGAFMGFVGGFLKTKVSK